MKLELITPCFLVFTLVCGVTSADPKPDQPAEPLPEVFSPPPFEVPPGFTVEVAAAPPLVKHPIMAGFDDKGRLYVAESAGLNLPKVDLEKQLPNGILRLEDTDGDGKFDKRTVFADKMTFPQGALWHDGSLYVASSGGIWKLTDFNDDGVADERVLLVSKFGYTGNAADVHGCFLGPDGRIYWCEGRHGHEITDKEGKLISKGKAARVFSCKTDGSDVQVFAGGGMDNPVEVDWTEEGEMLGTANIFYQKRGDTLIHWVRGGVYPRLDQPECLAEFPRTGEPLDAVHDFGHVAVSGCMRYRSYSFDFDEPFRNNWFVTEFNTHKVVRCVLEREGSTFKATVHEFLKAKSDDFHPTDVLEDADGSLLVIDTGGWFRIGCPTSQVAKSHILGGIYRVRKTDAKKVEDPRGLSIKWRDKLDSDLIKMLGDERPVVRTRTLKELERRPSGLSRLELVQNGSLETLWYSFRRHRDLTNLFNRRPPDERQLQVYFSATSRSEFSDAGISHALRQLRNADSPPTIREGAAFLGAQRNKQGVPVLFELLSRPMDRFLEHSIVYALIEIGDRDETAKGLRNPYPAVRRVALRALDQMKDGNLQRSEAVDQLAVSDLSLQATSLEIIARRQWIDEVITFAAKALEPREQEQPIAVAAERAMVANALSGLIKEKRVQELIATNLSLESLPQSQRKLLLDVLSQGDLPVLTPELAAGVRLALSSTDPEVLRAAVLAAKGEDFDDPLLIIARNNKGEDETRLAAFATAASHKKPFSESDVAWLKNQVVQSDLPLSRITAARALGTAALTTDQLKVVATLVSEVGPLELSPLLAAFSSTTDDTVGKELATALAKSPGAGSLTLTQLESLLKPFSAEARKPAQPLLEKLASAAKDQRERLEMLLTKLDGGNAQAGRDIFVNKRAACTACHRVGSDGGKIGPDLTKVGERRSQRDLLEAVLFPSATVGQGFETYVIQTTGGQTVTGLVTRRTADALYLRTPDQKDIRLATADIEQMKPSPVSIMPSGLEQTMTHEQLRDLIAYLRSLQ